MSEPGTTGGATAGLRALVRRLPALVVRGHDDLDRRLSLGGVRAGTMAAPAAGTPIAVVLAECRAADVQTVRSLGRGGVRPVVRTGFRRLSTSAFLTALRAYRLRRQLPRLLRIVRRR